MDGVHTVIRVFVPMLQKSGSQLEDESFRTLLSEVMCIVNNRPTPNHIITMKTKLILPPRGEFHKLMCIVGKYGDMVILYVLILFYKRLTIICSFIICNLILMAIRSYLYFYSSTKNVPLSVTKLTKKIIWA